MKYFMRYKSANNENNIYATVWTPHDDNSSSSGIKGILQIAHGMAEHTERYDDFANFMVSAGYIVCANDHAGHGRSAKSPELRGYFGEENGHITIVKDVFRLSKLVVGRYPGVPLILLGHSMGSFVARAYAANYGEMLSKIIIMGTGGGGPFINAGLALAKLSVKKYGALSPGKHINALGFGSFNKRCLPKRTNVDWLSNDPEKVDAYIADEQCGFLFTNKGYQDLFMLYKSATGNRWAKQIPTSLPILLISGDADPVGEYGRGVIKTVTELANTGHSNVTLKLIEGARHEILNEVDRQDVYKYILNWISST